MKILAFDSSSEILSIAVFDGSRKIASFESSGFTRHSSVLLPTIAKLLKNKKIRLESVDVIAVGLGPGSFTGLRVGITSAKVLSYALKAKLIGVPSLDAMAAGQKRAGKFTIAVDARRGKFYAASYEKKKDGLKVIERSKLIEGETLNRPKYNVIQAGDGTAVYPEASWTAYLAMEAVKKGKFTDPLNLEPLYLYPRDCNVTPKKK